MKFTAVARIALVALVFVTGCAADTSNTAATDDTANTDGTANAASASPEVGDHWHAAYEIYLCGERLPMLYPDGTSMGTGLHSHGDSLFHIHPFTARFAGQFSTIGVFFEDGGWELSDSRIELPDGTVIDENDFRCVSGGDKAEIRILQWDSLDAEDPTVFTEGFSDIHFRQDAQLYTLAIVEKNTNNADIPRPDDGFLRAYLGLDEVPETS